MKIKKEGFTLAEVLITLGIIGVVAAMTIPTLITNTNSQKFRSQYKKTLSTLNQMVRMNQAQYDWNFSDIKVACGNNGYNTNAKADEARSVCAMVNSNLTAATQHYSEVYTTLTSGKIWGYISSTGSFVWYNLSDGARVGLSTNEPCTQQNYKTDITTSSSQPLRYCGGFIDVNGDALPNKEVKCSDGTAKYIGDTDYTIDGCKVDNKTMGDVFPIAYYDSTVVPASNAAQYVLNSAK